MSIESINTQNYIDILEKTNTQLSLWYNPYGLMIGILSILIAVLAILFAFILWRQGKDYKDAFNTFLDEQKEVSTNEIKKVILEARGILDEQINTQTLKLENLEDKNGEAQE